MDLHHQCCTKARLWSSDGEKRETFRAAGALHDLKSKSESGRGFRVKAKPAINSASIADTQFQSCDYIETRSAAFIVNDAKDLA
jgi:hypothetical protein